MYGYVKKKKKKKKKKKNYIYGYILRYVSYSLKYST